MEETTIIRPSVMMQLYAILDDPEHHERDDCTQFVVEENTTLSEAIDFLSEHMAPDLWGVSQVELVGIVALDKCEDRNVKTRKVLTSFPLERIFVQGHQDCLVVAPATSNDAQDESMNTEDSTDYPTDVKGEFDYLLDEDHGSDDDGEESSTDAAMTEEDEGTTDEENKQSLPLHLMTAGPSALSIADTEAESTTPLTGFERADSTHNGDDETAEQEQDLSALTVSPAVSPAKRKIDNTEEDAAEGEGAIGTEELNKCGQDVASRALPANAPAASGTNSPDGENDTEKEHGTGDAKPASVSSGGNSIGLAYDVPIESDDSGGEHDAAVTTTSAAATDLPPWTKEDTKDKDVQETENEQDKQNGGAIAAGVATGVVAAGAVAAGVLASNDKQEGEQPESADEANTVVKSVPGIATVPKSEDVEDKPSPGPNVAAMVSLFEKEDKDANAEKEIVSETKEKPVVSNSRPDYSQARNVNDPSEVHLLDGFTTEEEDDVDLFKPEIPQNLKTRSGNNLRHGDSEFDGISEQESVKTMEFPDDLHTASSFDNVVVVDLPDESSETKADEATPANVTQRQKEKESVPDTTSDNGAADVGKAEVTVEPKEKQSTIPATSGAVGGAGANDAPAKSKDTLENDSKIPTTNTNAVPDTSEGMMENFDSWNTDVTQQDEDDASNSFRPLKKPEANNKESQVDARDAPMTFPSLLGNAPLDWQHNSDTEGEPLLPDRQQESDAAPHIETREAVKAPSPISYKIGSTYFLLRERDGIEYPVKILSLEKRGTCIVEYTHHRAKKKIRTSSLLPDTPERREKFEEQIKNGEITNDLPARISKELKERKSERHARHEERRRYGHHVSRENLPTCSTEGTVLEFKSRRVYFAKDKETVKDIGKKFNVPSDRIVYDNKVAYPSLKKTSRLRPLTSIVLPPAENS